MVFGLNAPLWTQWCQFMFFKKQLCPAMSMYDFKSPGVVVLTPPSPRIIPTVYVGDRAYDEYICDMLMCLGAHYLKERMLGIITRVRILRIVSKKQADDHIPMRNACVTCNHKSNERT